MALVRDPAFWKRFSVAVHLEDEIATAKEQQDQELKQTDSWLARQQQKRARRTAICWAFWIGFFAFVAGLVVVILWLEKNGEFAKLGKEMEPHR